VNWVKRAIATRLDGIEDRSLAPPSVDPHLPLLTGAPVQDVSTSNALRISDAFACIRALADSVASLPLHAYRRTSAGRVPAGGDSRIVRLLSRPAPGSTIADLMSLVMVHLNVYGEAFVGKYRGADGEIVQLGLIDPTTVDVELDGQRVIYRLMSAGVEVGPSDVLHIKGMSSDGLRGLSPVTACRLALQLSSSLQTAAAALSANDGRPSGILTVPGPSSDAVVEDVRERWDQRHGGPLAAGRIAVVAGNVGFTPVSFSASDAQFLQQRELSAREVARIFRVPAWLIDAPTGDSLTYSNVLEQNRAFVSHSLRPWLVRLERAISGDPDLCPGGTYVEFDLDGLLRADAGARAAIYSAALNPTTGWMTRAEVRELEDLPPEAEPPRPAAAPEEDTRA
jgi:HK97 family phage portal protein